MERKNTILLTVIAVATLLVAVVGATFAYFTASTNADGNASGETSAKTATMPQVSFNKETISNTANTIYPGTYNAVGAGFTTQVTDALNGSTDKSYTIAYTVGAKVELQNNEGNETDFDFPVKWRLYESTDKIDANAIVTCQNVETETVGTEVHYTQECNESEKIGTLVQSGVINKEGDCEQSGGDNGKNQIACGKSATISYSSSIDSSSTLAKKYYYLVVDYPDAGSEQNTDLNKKIKASITDITVNSSTEKKG